MADEPRQQLADPTPLTTDQLTREIGHLKELTLGRFTANERAIDLFQENITRVPTDTDKQIGHLKELIVAEMTEGFRSIALQFAERDTRTDQMAKATETAVNAALQAQKEAAGKSEGGFTKMMDQQVDLMRTVTGGLADQINELRNGLTAVQGRMTGGTEMKADNRGIVSISIAAASVIVAIIIGVVAITLRKG